MKRGLFGHGESLPIAGISDINLAYDINMEVEGYHTLSSDIPKLSELE